MKRIELEISIAYGWCYLLIRTQAGAEVRIRTHWLVDGFADLAESFEELLRGRPTASVRWPHELAGGSFLDFVADPHGGLHVAITEFRFGSSSSAVSEVWSAERGRCLLALDTPLSEFSGAYLNALHKIRAESVDPTGHIKEWRHSFPQAVFERLGRIATRRFGYKPATADEICQ